MVFLQNVVGDGYENVKRMKGEALLLLFKFLSLFEE